MPLQPLITDWLSTSLRRSGCAVLGLARAGSSQGNVMYVASVLLLRSPLLPLLDPHFLLWCWWWAVIITSVAVIMVMKMTCRGGEGRVKLPFVSIGHEQELGDLDYLGLHQDPMTSSAVTVSEVQPRDAGAGEAHTSVGGANDDTELEQPVGVLGLWW